MAKKYNAFTLIEMTITMVFALIIILAAGALLFSGERGWQNLYNSIHNPIRQDAQKFTITFGILGRKSNKNPNDYKLYTISEQGAYQQALASGNDREVVIGDAVEFVFWDVPFDASDSHDLLDTDKHGTRYALIYPDGDQLKIDYGDYPPSAVVGSSRRNPERTEVLADNVTFSEFSHTTYSKKGRGCIRANIELTDPETNETTTIKAATLMRNIWPR